MVVFPSLVGGYGTGIDMDLSVSALDPNLQSEGNVIYTTQGSCKDKFIKKHEELRFFRLLLKK